MANFFQPAAPVPSLEEQTAPLRAAVARLASQLEASKQAADQASAIAYALREDARQAGAGWPADRDPRAAEARAIDLARKVGETWAALVEAQRLLQQQEERDGQAAEM